MSALELTMTASLNLIGAVLALAGISKAANFQWFAAGLRKYELVPQAAVPPVAALVVLSEVVLGTALVFGLLLPWSVYAAAGLFGMFGASLASTLVRRMSLQDCGCVKTSCEHQPSWAGVVRTCGFGMLLLLPSAGEWIGGGWLLALWAMIVVAVVVALAVEIRRALMTQKSGVSTPARV